MQLASRFELLFGVPRHGWLPVTVVVDDVELICAASNVLNDPLRELADAAVAIDGRDVVRESVGLWLEPDWMHLQFEAHADSDVVHVILYDETAHVAVLTGAASRSTVLDEIVRALLALQPSASNDDALEGWGTFPSQVVSVLLGNRNREEVAAGLPPPWRLFPDVPRIHEELVCEIGRRHPLYRRELTIVAMNDVTDEYLVELRSGPEPYAVVALTWSGTRERDPSLPRTKFFRSWREWRTAARRRGAAVTET